MARELLTESGSLFVQIGDENVHLVRCVLDEVFGSENFVSQIFFRKTSGAGSPGSLLQVASVGDYLLWYAKNTSDKKVHHLFTPKGLEEGGADAYRLVLLPDLQVRSLQKTESLNPELLPEGAKIFRIDNITSQSGVDKTRYPVIINGDTFIPNKGVWKTSKEGMDNLLLAGRVKPGDTTIGYVRFLDDFPGIQLSNLWDDTAISGAVEKVYVVQTITKVIERCILMTTDPGDLVLDPTCGSGTTAYVAEQRGRRWITIDTSRVAIALARTRLMAGRFPYYLLSDSPEGALKEAELTGILPSPSGRGQGEGDIRRGFVYRRVPHVTLKSIANNEEIDVIHEKWQAQLEALRAQLNTLLGQTWEEWQIPRVLLPSPAGRGQSEGEMQGKGDSQGKGGTQGERDSLLPSPAGRGQGEGEMQGEGEDLLAQWWALRRQRQQEIDASIARRADTELLYDQPYEDHKRVRVTGPFTVESLSPHRVLSMDEERPKSELDGQNQVATSGGFETLIIDNLRVAGVENTKKGERLKFTRLEPYAGTWLHAVGEYEEKSPSPSEGEGTEMRVKRVAVCIGPEHGTVSPDLIKDAAKEAVQGVGFDLLVVLGFAFDPHVSEEIHRYGKLTVLPARINPDLQMGNLLLKKSGAANLFMVFGEPDMEVTAQPDEKLTVTIKGVDIYDPTTGEIRSSSTDEIACWFIDTSYNGESFFVRHAYFTGADEPYEKLKRALRAEVDEAAWSELYATTSMLFERPESGKIAVKVINHYGDEVLKVFTV